MSRTQRTMVVPMVLIVILLSDLVGGMLGTVSPREWDLLLARLQDNQVISVAPTSNTQATLYVLDVNQAMRQELMVDLCIPGNGYGSGPASMLILLTTETGTVEMPLDNDLALRMELVPDSFYTDDELEPSPMFSAQIAGR